MKINENKFSANNGVAFLNEPETNYGEREWPFLLR